MFKKYLPPILLILLTLATLSGCIQSNKYDYLKDVPIVIDGDPQEWEPFPIVHNDPEGDNTSYEYDISTVKAFANNDTRTLYILVESYIPPQDITSIELDLLYNDALYRLGIIPGNEVPGVLARENEDGEWEVVNDRVQTNLAVGDAIEMSIAIDEFPATKDLKISNLHIMGGVCCNQYEYYSIDSITKSK